MERLDEPILGLVLATVFIAALLSALGEPRVDAYASLAILAYFLAVALSERLRRVPRRWLLDTILLFVFAVIVAYRVMEVLEAG